MAAYKTWQSWLKDHSIPKPNQVDNPIEVFVEACWYAATKSAEEKFTSHNTGSPKLLGVLDRVCTLIASRGEKNLNAALVKLNAVVAQLRAGA